MSSRNAMKAEQLTTTTQGLVEADRYKSVLRHLDELLCEIISGDQGSFEPHPGTRDMAWEALEELRKAYPTDEQNRDAGISDTRPEDDV